jgi:hypothetical protein
MIIYAVEAVNIFSDYPHHPDIINYHISREKAEDAANSINNEPPAYDEYGHPKYTYYNAVVSEIEVLE